MEKFKDRCCFCQHATVLNSQSVDLLRGGYFMKILSLTCEYMCKSILNTLQLM